MTDFQQPSTVTELSDVEDLIFPASDFRDDEPQDKPPKLWIEPIPVRLVIADDVLTYTIPVPSISDNATPLMIVPQVGNNERKRATLFVQTNTLYISGQDSMLVLPGFVGAASPVNSFRLNANILFTYESAAALFACSAGAPGTFGYVSVMIESYQQQPS